jgi:serine/threonine protein kinase
VRLIAEYWILVQLIALIYGADFHILEPRGVPFGHEDYDINILMRLFQFFGPFPPRYRELIEGNEEINMIIQYLFEKIPQSEMKPFSQVSNREVSRQDKEFICKMMKMDPRERPTAKELLQDDWFKEKLGDEFQVELSSNCVHSADVTPWSPGFVFSWVEATRAWGVQKSVERFGDGSRKTSQLPWSQNLL